MFMSIGLAAYTVFVFGYAGVLTSNVNTHHWGGTMPGPWLLVTWVRMFLTGPLLLVVALPLRLLGIRMFPVFIPPYR